MKIPFEPIKLEEDGIPVYSSDDVNKYGKPDIYNVFVYIVIDVDPSPLVYHKCTDMKILPFHRYCRKERFRSTVNFLLGKGKVPFEVFEKVIEQCSFSTEEELWTDISKILSKSGNWKYVNRIPTITKMLGYNEFFETRRLEFIYERFDKASDRFDYLKDRNLLDERKYFPGLRYVAFRLLAEHHAKFNYPVPLMKTKSKLKPYDILFNKLFN